MMWPATWLLGACCLQIALASGADSALVLVQGSLRVHGGSEIAQVAKQDPAAGASYAYTSYNVGDIVEGKMRNGSWVTFMIVGNGDEWGLYHLHMTDDFPGFDLPNTPFQMMRRLQRTGESDYYVDNSLLQHRGSGLKYRNSMDLQDSGEEYAPWGTMVVATDEGDGWIKTDRGYLPTVVHDMQVLVKKERQPTRIPMHFVQRVNGSAAVLAAAPKGQITFEQGEHSEFLSKRGDWYPCHITGPGRFRGTYDVVVTPSDYAQYPVTNVPLLNLRKNGPVAPSMAPAVAKAPTTEPPACKKEGCVLLRVKNQQGREFLLQVARGAKMDMMMKMVCNRMRVEFTACQAQNRFMHNGEEISPSVHLEASGLQEQDLIEMADATATPEVAAVAPAAGAVEAMQFPAIALAAKTTSEQ